MAISRLKAAWAALGACAGGLIVAAVLAPPPMTEPRAVEIALPDEPERFAPRSPDAADARSVAPDPGAAPAGAAPLPQVVVDPGALEGEDAGGSGEVVITVSGAGDPPAPRARPAVPPSAPDPALTRRTEAGTRPATGPDGRTPFATYRRLQPLGGEERGVAVIVSGLGLDAGLTEAATALPPAVSLAFAPYAKDLPEQVEAARRAGHEVLLELPMGTPGVAPAALGPAGLLSERAPEANAERLGWLLSRAPAYPMVTNYLGRGFASDPAALAPVMAEVARTGTAYVDDTGLAEAAARAAGVPYARADALIEPDAEDVGRRLQALAAGASPGEVALAKVYATPASVRAVAAWAAALPEDAALVPASTKVAAR